MLMLDIYKNSNTYKILKKDIESGTINHSYMIVVPDKKLADEFAKFFAMQLFCVTGFDVCGGCVNCKKIMHDNAGDIKYFPANARLSVEESRQIVADSQVKPYELKKKLFVIKNFSTATPQSQNALLKVLEEPTSTNIFLIITDSETGVLRTIQSRVKKIIESAVEDDNLKKFIEKEYASYGLKDIDSIVCLAKGNVTLADNLITNKVYKALSEDILEVIRGIQASKDVLRLSNILMKYKDNFNECLDIMLQTFLDIKVDIVSKNDKSRFKNYPNILDSYTPNSITYISKVILECKNRVKFNCNTIGVIDYLLFGILEAKFLCK